LKAPHKVQLNADCDLAVLELSDKEYLIIEALTLQEELRQGTAFGYCATT
jgi:hypothetical protein